MSNWSSHTAALRKRGALLIWLGKDMTWLAPHDGSPGRPAVIPPERHATVFAALQTLHPGATFVLINDHAPIPLLRPIAEVWPGLFQHEFLLDGPEVWQVASTRVGT